MNLHECLEEYKALTLTLIDEAKKDGNLEQLIEKREEILKFIKNSSFNEEEIRSIGNSFNLLELEEELQSELKKEQVKIKKEIENLNKRKQANMQYNRFENRSRIFNRNI